MEPPAIALLQVRHKRTQGCAVCKFIIAPYGLAGQQVVGLRGNGCLPFGCQRGVPHFVDSRTAPDCTTVGLRFALRRAKRTISPNVRPTKALERVQTAASTPLGWKLPHPSKRASIPSNTSVTAHKHFGGNTTARNRCHAVLLKPDTYCFNLGD